MESVKAFKRKMLLWVHNWSQEDGQRSTEEVPFTPDAMDIASLLQAMGFRVRFMDRCPPKEMHPVPGVPADNPACRVILMCPNSGIRMELDAETSSCRCPPSDKSDLGNSWAIEEPSSQEMAKAVHPLGQQVTNEIGKTVSQAIGGLLQVMSLFPETNHCKDLNENIQSSFIAKTGISDPNQSATSNSGGNSPMKTPATGIAVVTPNAPCVPKASPEDPKTVVPGRYRSLDTLISSGGFPDDLPEPGQLTPKDEAKSQRDDFAMEVDGELDTTITQSSGSAKKKFISKSSPAVNGVENFQRSSTFVFEGEEEDEISQTKGIEKQKLVRGDTFVSNGFGDNDEEEPRMGPPPRRTPSPLIPSKSNQPSDLLNKLQEIQLALSDVIFEVAGNEKNLSNIGDVSKASKALAVQKLITDNKIRPIRCLSDFGSVPNLTRAATTIRSIPRPIMRRHPTIAAPATPTTSRRGGTNVAVDKTKKGSTGSINGSLSGSITSNRLSVFSGNGSQKTGKTLSASKKESVLNTSLSRRTIHSEKRLSHVESSIPKSSGTSKK